MRKLSKTYLPEVDGLRAVAVVLVVAFHAWPSLVTGGFIGVDVFFVISGFVIARTYLQGLIDGKITVGEFYMARIRRLGPAVLVVLLATTFAMSFVAFPDHLIRYAWSLLAQPFSLQNFVFWSEGDYFEGSLSKPLLHTWSLAVEEQFYLAWLPLIVMLRWRRWLFWPSLLAITVASLVAGMILEPRSPKTVFYLLPFRVWEFALGVAAFRLAQQVPVHLTALRLIAWLCLILILWTAIGFSAQDRFPGPQAILACLATAILLMAIEISNGTLIHPLRQSVICYIGRVSYGFYLWHWPPLVIWALVAQEASGPLESGLLMLGAFAVASASYHFIELPARTGNWFRSKRRLITSYAIASLILIIGVISIKSTNGLAIRYPEQLRPYFLAAQERGGFRCGKVFILLNPDAELCPLAPGNPGGRAVLVIGDSHADVLKEALSEQASIAGVRLLLAVRNCDLGRFGSTRFCSETVRDTLVEQALEQGVSRVVAASFFRDEWLDDKEIRDDATAFAEAGLELYIMLTVPRSESFVAARRAEVALEKGPLDESGLDRAVYEQQLQVLRRELNEVAASGIVFRLLEPADALCSEVECSFSDGGLPLYFDSNHVTFKGARRLASLFERVFAQDAESAGGSP